MLKSILIITYGREKELYETLRDIYPYEKDDLEVLLLDNNETNYRKEKIIKIFEKSKVKLRYFHDGMNYGVALGRNYVIEKAKGEILVTLDDDIEIKDINSLIYKIENYFKELPEVGCLAFNIKNFYTRKPLRHEIPHGNKNLDFSKNLETYYFIGAGHAIRKKVYEECGKYPNNLGKYGGEEEDLSYRIVEKYKIQYCSDLEIFHKVSQNGRITRKEEDYLRYRNKIIVRSRYLLPQYQISNYIIWSLYYLLKKNGKLKEVVDTGKQLNSITKIENSRKKYLNKKLKKLKARILY
ncbi:glycosyltransferase family 2 protein [Fusobacterium ulcerans]|uniref:glycosyltransferase family 2 protein n=1 Tax=Fusobacterium ulcerans TaxID=861 RepID=UPI0010328A09|nr:glycosyltransferase family 2 protein [Fusobacterium ulcerans]